MKDPITDSAMMLRSVFFLLCVNSLLVTTVYPWILSSYTITTSGSRRQRPYATALVACSGVRSSQLRSQPSLGDGAAANTPIDSNNNKNNDSNDNGSLLSFVSDAEALLACRAYLRKRKKLGGWTQQQRRQFLQQQEKGDDSNLTFLVGDEAASNLRLADLVDDFVDEDDNSNLDAMFNNSDSSSMSSSPSSSSSSEQIAVYGRPVNTLEWAESFISAPNSPSVTHQKRSAAALKTWQQPERKAYWYQQRWGKRKQQQALSSSSSTTTPRQQQQIRKIQQFQQLLNTSNLNEFLSLDDWDSMTPTEMEQAIRTYILSNQKRVLSRKTTMHDRKAALQQNWLDITSSSNNNNSTATTNHSTDGSSHDTTSSTTTASTSTIRHTWKQPTHEELQERRQQRAEKSRLSYQKRLENQQQQQQRQQQLQLQPILQPDRNGLSTTLTSTIQLPVGHGNSPQDALTRLQQIVQLYPSTFAPALSTPTALPLQLMIDDVKLVVMPNKLTGRKELLRQILVCCFQLRGKCVPPMDLLLLESDSVMKNDPIATTTTDNNNSNNDKDYQLSFVTQCTVDHLGQFILFLLRQQQQQLQVSGDLGTSGIPVT